MDWSRNLAGRTQPEQEQRDLNATLTQTITRKAETVNKNVIVGLIGIGLLLVTLVIFFVHKGMEREDLEELNTKVNALDEQREHIEELQSEIKNLREERDKRGSVDKFMEFMTFNNLMDKGADTLDMEQIRARRITVVDDEGQARIQFGLVEDKQVPVLRFSGEQEDVRIEMFVNPSGPVVRLMDEKSKPRARLYLNNGEAELSLADETNQPRVGLGINSDGPMMYVIDEDSKPVWTVPGEGTD
ncbi:MAG: hypothetical protein ACOC0A_02030 [Planctomycetota bacterium]